MRAFHSSSLKIRLVGVTVALLWVACEAISAQAADIAGPWRDFRSDYPSPCSPDEAREIFHRHIRQLRREHRATIARLVAQFEREATHAEAAAAPNKTPDEAPAAGQLPAMLRLATDARTAMLIALQYRSHLPDHQQERVAAIVEELQPLVEANRQAQLAYQHYLAEAIRRRWQFLDQSEKRGLLQEYFHLAGEDPEWLLERRTKVPLPLAPSTANNLDGFERRAQRELREAEKAFEPQRAGLLASLQTALRKDVVSETERQALEWVVKLLQADYGKGFRGMMILEPDVRLPEKSRQRLAAFTKAFRAELARLRAERSTQLSKLEQLLGPVRGAHLESGEFSELMAIDIRLDELKQVVRPLRILARREPGIDWPEEAWLLDVRDDDFQVRFLRDLREVWLPRAQVLLTPAVETLPAELAGQPPADGPGTPLTDRTELRTGQTLMAYHDQTWYPVTVVDVSPFGVAIAWRGYREDASQLVPRSRLRLLSDP